MGKDKKNIEFKLTDEDIRKIEESRQRRKKREQGFYDGRFVTKPMDNKKYSRKVKHKGSDTNV